MLKDILLYLFNKRLSIIDTIVVINTMLLIMDRKYKWAIALFIIGGLITIGFELWLGI